jgi:hypothetical protein
MAQAGYTPIQLYHSTVTGAVPSAANLLVGEAAINVTDRLIFTKDSGGNVVEIGGGGINYTLQTANYTAEKGEGVLADTSGGAFTVTLPASPSTGDQVVVADPTGDWGTNNLTVGRNGSTIAGVAQDLVCDISGVSVQLVYDGSTWAVYAQVGGNGGTVVTLNGVQTLTNKTLTTPVISQISNTGTLTLPTSTDTLVGRATTDTLTNKTITNLIFDGNYTEEVFTITDGGSVDLNPANGTVQVWTLGASRSPTATSFASGQSMTLMVDDGSAYTITWPSVTWKTDSGNPPTLNTTGFTAIVLWKVSTTLYGARVGNN